jgi:twitching motility two-component system response regulator PilH
MSSPPPPLDSRRILVVDDQESIRTLLESALSEAGAEVITAAGGAEALEAARSHAPQLILLDLAMPGMNGWQVLEALRGSSITAGIPVVLQTSAGDFPSVEQARKQGVAAFISKPFRLGDVVETCRRTLLGARPFMGHAAENEPPASVQVRDGQGLLLAVGTLVDSDTAGAQIELETALAQGQQIALTVLGASGPERRDAEVRWVAREDRRFVHGLRFRK